MAVESELKIKELGASGAITTNNIPGRLYHVFITGTKAGDKVEILDGATNRLTFLIPTDNGSVEWEPPQVSGKDVPKFSTDIDCTITETTGAVTATFIYTEIT